MVLMTEPVIRMIKHPGTNKIMTTVSPEGMPHAIVCGSLDVTEPDTIIAGEAFMYRASEHLRKNPNAEFLVWKGKDAYSIKAVAKARVDVGPIFDRMSAQLEKMGMACAAVWIFEATEVWDEGISSTTGDRVI